MRVGDFKGLSKLRQVSLFSFVDSRSVATKDLQMYVRELFEVILYGEAFVLFVGTKIILVLVDDIVRVVLECP